MFKNIYHVLKGEGQGRLHRNHRRKIEVEKNSGQKDGVENKILGEAKEHQSFKKKYKTT